MIYIAEEQQEYEMMYHYVMRNNNKAKNKDGLSIFGNTMLLYWHI